MVEPQSLPTRNRLLLALPSDNRAQLLRKLCMVLLPVRKVLVAPKAIIEAVYFVESGWVSMVASLQDGTQAEVGFIGREGMAGGSLASGIGTSFVDVFVQGEGSARQMQAEMFERELDENPDLRRLTLRYNEAMHAQAMQTAACNGRHSLAQRLARWLLMAHDRIDGDILPLTQEFLSVMLCVHRPGVTVAAGVLQEAGIIRYEKGRIAILDRAALEKASCACYRAVTDRFTEMLG